MKLKNGQIIVYEISKEYLNFLRKLDHRVSVKQHRRFIGILLSDKGTDYCIPLSTKVYTSKGYQRVPNLTTTIYAKGNPIAVLLHNNMIPVPPSELTIVDIDNEPDKAYLLTELRYLSRHKEEILKKSEFMLTHYHIGKLKRKICVNLGLLEREMKKSYMDKKKEVNNPYALKENRAIKDLINKRDVLLEQADKSYKACFQDSNKDISTFDKAQPVNCTTITEIIKRIEKDCETNVTFKEDVKTTLSDMKELRLELVPKVLILEQYDETHKMNLMAVKDHVFYYEQQTDSTIYAIHAEVMGDKEAMMKELDYVIENGFYRPNQEVKNIYVYADDGFASCNYDEIIKDYRTNESSFDYVSDEFIGWTNDCELDEIEMEMD